ncbi:hypothetical protein DACRYDRAFT_117734 [Dacryopinax primogenitus]|uniref:Glycosyltransferase family 18 catalytic domain-containing protein n=1 Tax=Dacryopinax primogenitus (strain DJM 731) TaxID=1858805 RepID=M5FV64_DACPD|nr:uncharacterized protein DACRYDRAFT_117734 [Dacryopinax primogenitus]EJT99494.1 hypothetical protein DACRYDRAFT_117734 [Dacryopinax primogenitus]
MLPLPRLRSLLLILLLALLILIPTLLYLEWPPLLSLSPHLRALSQPIEFPWRTKQQEYDYPDPDREPGEDDACPFDPFLAPGMLYFGTSANETRWVPFPLSESAYTPGSLGLLEDLDQEQQLTEREMQELGTAERLMLGMAEGGGEWARGKGVLFVGSSHDRNNVQNFCDAVGGVHTSWGMHTGGFCKLARLEFTIVYWFMYGIPDSESYDWHAPNEPRPITPARRVKEVFLPQMEQVGLRGWTPDLVVVSSLFWDTDHLFDKYFTHMGIKRPWEQGLTWQEVRPSVPSLRSLLPPSCSSANPLPQVRWHQTSSSSLLSLLRSTYPPLTPLMYRSRHIRASNDKGQMLRVQQLDMAWRAVARRAGVRVFDWGGRLEGYTPYYDGNQHFPNGPATWLFGEPGQRSATGHNLHMLALLQRVLLLAGGSTLLLLSIFFRPLTLSTSLPLPPPRHRPDSAHFESLFPPLPGSAAEERTRAENARTVRALVGCLARGDCGENQSSVVILASPQFGPEIEAHNNPDGAWALSVQDALDQLGYTYLWFPSLSSALPTYVLFPDLVRLVLASPPDVSHCFASQDCIKSPSNPLGPPIWKLFAFSPQGSTDTPLGAEWSLSPEEYGTGARVLGYSIEDSCRKVPYVPPSAREAHVYILGDRLSYWYHRDFAWEDGVLWGLRDAFFLEVSLVGGLVNDTRWETYWPPYMNNYGLMAKEDYYSLLSHSQVLVGSGIPANSPAAYEALCFGVPFINPILRWDEKRPFHRESWVTQHDALKHLEPPFVYHVRKMDGEGLIKAVRAARGSPIGRYIPANMHQSALRQRVSDLVETDWRSKAQEVLSRRVAAFESPLFEL